MRLVPAAAVLLAAAPALADRGAVLVLGITGDARATGASFTAAGVAETKFLAGGRLTLSFDNPPPPILGPGTIAADVRLAPELLAGFVSDDTHAEGYLGAGLRGELWLTTARRGFHMRTAMYTAGRAIVIGGRQDGAVELVLGEYLLFARGVRFGWEGGAQIRRRNDIDARESRELDALASIYVGW